MYKCNKNNLLYFPVHIKNNSLIYIMIHFVFLNKKIIFKNKKFEFVNFELNFKTENDLK